MFEKSMFIYVYKYVIFSYYCTVYMYSYTGCTDCTQYKTVKLTPEPVHTAPTSYLSLVSYIHQGVNTYAS